MQRPTEERFRSIYLRHVDAVTAYVRRRTEADSVEDVVAETFLVCWRRFDRVPDEPLPWLYAVARKTLANRHRAAARHGVEASVRQTSEASELVGDPVLARAFALLGEPDREVLRLVAWEQLSLREAATALGCSYVACRVRFHRARRRLAANLETLDERAATAVRPPHVEGATQR
jgi:RNA polymerase sigma-70 factor (ECF subfamily)